MHRNAVAGASSFIVASVLACVALAASPLHASAPTVDRAPTVGSATRQGKSAALRDYRPVGPVLARPSREIPNRGVPKKGSDFSRATSDPVAQRQFGRHGPSRS